MKDTIAIIIPCYNEATRLFSTRKKIVDNHTTLSDYNISYTFVNDGSIDNTKNILEDIYKDGEEKSMIVKVISYKENKGKGYAVKTGILQTEADFYLIMDADLATDITEIIHFLQNRNRADCIIGDRTSILAQRDWHKKILGKISHLIITQTLGLKVADTQCGFKLFSKKVKPLRSKIITERRGFDFEFLYLLGKNNFSLLEIPVKWQEMSGSKVKYRDYIKTLHELYLVRKKHS